MSWMLNEMLTRSGHTLACVLFKKFNTSSEFRTRVMSVLTEDPPVEGLRATLTGRVKVSRSIRSPSRVRYVTVALKMVAATPLSERTDRTTFGNLYAPTGAAASRSQVTSNGSTCVMVKVAVGKNVFWKQPTHDRIVLKTKIPNSRLVERRAIHFAEQTGERGITSPRWGAILHRALGRSLHRPVFEDSAVIVLVGPPTE